MVSKMWDIGDLPHFHDIGPSHFHVSMFASSIKTLNNTEGVNRPQHLQFKRSFNQFWPIDVTLFGLLKSQTWVFDKI